MSIFTRALRTTCVIDKSSTFPLRKAARNFLIAPAAGGYRRAHPASPATKLPTYWQHQPAQAVCVSNLYQKILSATCQTGSYL